MMLRLYENSKVKRVLSCLILFSMVLTSFITSTTETAYATTNSNSRRMTSINLAAGVGFGGINNFDDIDETSLQTIAIYLSNFYLPFITILDGDYTKEGAEDSGNSQHVQAMKDALVKNCGFDKAIAEYVVGYVLNQSLASCKTVYMKTDDLKDCFKYTNYDGEKSYLGFSNGGYFSGLVPKTKVDDLFAALWSDSSIYYTREVIKNGGIFSSAEYGDWDYINTVGSITVGNSDYTPVSYAIFLGVMARVAYKESTKKVRDLGDITFYTLLSDDSGLRMSPVFSNSDYCRGMLLQALQYCDIENGFSTGFSSISGTDVEGINNPEATQYSLVCAPNVYVNWEGSLIYDNGVYRTVILPGCMNPYMMNSWDTTTQAADYVTVAIDAANVEKIYSTYDNRFVYYVTRTDGSVINNSGFMASPALMVNEAEGTITYLDSSYDKASWSPRFNFVNNTSLSSISLGLATKTAPISFSSTAYPTYRVTIGAGQSNFDQSWSPTSWGQNESIFDLLDTMEYMGVSGSGGADYARFPILTQYYDSDDVNVVKDNKKFCNLTTSASTSSTSIVFYNSFERVTSETQFFDMFPTIDVFDSKFISELQKYNIDTYAQFKNIKTQGHALSYPKSTQKMFQYIYLTYCFAAFNAEYDTYEKETNIVPLKLNFAGFPAGDIDIDWSSIQQEQAGNEIMSFVYYLLHPTEGVAYVATLFKNKVSGILLSWHEDIVGATSSNSATGMTKYLGTSSYTTMPMLSDISWVSGLLNIYNNIIVYLIILMCLILLCYVLTGAMTIQRGLVGVVLFGICAFLPPVAINGTVSAVNAASDAIFSKKFDFWAICQMQTFVESYQDAMDAQEDGDFSSYAMFVIGTQSSTLSAMSDDEASAATYSGAKVKWMAPKKYNSLASLVSMMNGETAIGNSSANFLKQTIFNIVAKSTSGETYLDDSESLYLYRDYADLFKYAHTAYNIMSTFNYNGKLGSSTDSAYSVQGAPLEMTISQSGATISSSYQKAWNSLVNEHLTLYDFVESGISTTLSGTAKAEVSSPAYIANGYLYDTVGFKLSPSQYATYQYLYGEGAGRNTLAISYLANYNRTYKEVHDAYLRLQKIVAGIESANVGSPSSTEDYYNFGLPKATKDSSVDGSYMWGYQEIIGLEEEDLDQFVKNADGTVNMTGLATIYKNLSDVHYGLYSESPFYYFNANIRDQANSTTIIGGDSYLYDFGDLTKGKQTSSEGAMNHISKMFLQNNQEYFFNLTDNAGDGFGELRDFTNMHDFFYFVIPYLREGVELARLYDDVFGLYVDDDCSLIVNADGSVVYDGTSCPDLDALGDLVTPSGAYTPEELYKLWHTYNTYTILSAYTPWIDTMLDCDYHKAETITVLGDKFRVSDPLNPYTYFTTNAAGELEEGRYMVFSRSEMNAMGLTTADLTTVERKIIQFQDNVYNNAINLMNYYTFSDEVMIQAYAMLQTFEFNKLFSQTSVVGESFVMYPQGYELKAFSYDAYLRMIVANASGESLMYNDTNGAGNVSIYERVMKNTSLFFGIFLLLNDILAVYVIPGLKIFFLVTIFVCSVLILVGSVIKMEMNIFSVMWKSLFAPLLSFSAICIGLSIIVSMFMQTGATGVVSSEFVIKVGDPTAAIILMIVLNVGVVILMFKICKKCFRDLITYGRAVLDNVGSTVVGAVGAVGAGFAAGRAMDRFGSSSSGGSGVSRTAKQRGKDNDPRSGRSGVGSAVAAGVGGAALGAAAAGAASGGGGDGAGGSGMAAGEGYDSMTAAEKQRFHDSKNRAEDTRGMNKYDKKAYEGATAKQDAARDKLARDEELVKNSTGLRKKRYELAQKMHQRQADNAAIKADNVKKYGTGVKSKIEGMKAAVGKGRTTRLDEINKSTAARNQERADRAQAALTKRDTERARPVTDAISDQTKSLNRVTVTQTRTLVGATTNQTRELSRATANQTRTLSGATEKQTSAITRSQRQTTRAVNRSNYGGSKKGTTSKKPTSSKGGKTSSAKRPAQTAQQRKAKATAANKSKQAKAKTSRPKK